MNGKCVNRALASVLAAAMVFTSVDLTGFAATGSYDAASGTWSGTAAELVADHYYSNSAAKEILTNAVIKQGDSYTDIELPTQTSLLATDSAAKKIYAKKFVSQGQTWMPVQARLVDNSGKELTTVKLTAGSASYGGDEYDASASFKTSAKSYIVEISYELNIEVSQAEQERLLSIPVELAEGVSNLKILTGTTMKRALADVQDALPTLNDNIELVEDEDAAGAITTLYKEYEDNNDRLTLQSMLEACDEDSTVGYLVEHGTDVKRQAKESYTTLYELYSNDYLQNLSGKVHTVAPEFGTALDDWNDALESLVGDDGALTSLKDCEWSILDAEDVFTDADSIDYASLDDAVNAVIDEDLTAPAVDTDALLAYETTVSANVSAGSVKVTVAASVAGDDAADLDALTDSTEDLSLKELTAAEQNMTFAANTAKKNVLSEITKSGLEGTALESWKTAGYEISAEEGSQYTREVTETVPDKITDTTAAEYTISYQPKVMTVTVIDKTGETESQTEKKVYFGSLVKLTECTVSGKNYDYVVTSGTEEAAQSEYHDQGDAIKVTEPVTITKTMGAAKTTERILSLLAKDKDYNFSDDEKAILSSAALKSSTQTLRYPTEAAVGDVTVSDGTYSVTPGSYDAGVRGLSWEPAGVIVRKGSSDITVTSETVDGKTTYSWNSNYDYVEVSYKLELTADSADLETWINLPAVLSAKVKAQDNTLQSAKDIYDDMESVSQFMTRTILSTVKGQMESADGQNAVDTLLKSEEEGGAWDSSSSNEPVMYTYLKACNANGWSVSSYYLNGKSEAMAAQAALLADCLGKITADPGIGKALDIAENQFNVANATQKLDTIKSIGTKLAALDFQAADEAMDMSDENSFTSLVTAALNATDVIEGRTAAGFNVYNAVNKDASGNGSVAITVQVGDALVQTDTYRYQFDTEETPEKKVNADDIAAITAKVSVLAAKAGLTEATEKYYEVKTYTDNTEGTLVADETICKTYIVQYTPKTYTVQSTEEGQTTEIGTFKYGNAMTVILPAPAKTSDETYYRYTIDGKDVDVYAEAAGSYTFTAEQLDRLFTADQTYTITRTSIQKKWEDIKAFVDNLNEKLKKEDSLKDSNGNLRVAFIPVKRNGSAEYDSIILRVVPDKEEVNKTSAKDFVTALATALASTSYDYIGFGGKYTTTTSDYQFKFMNENNEMKINPQSIVDVILHSDVTNNTIIDTVTEDGKIKETMKDKISDGSAAQTTGVIADDASLGGIFASTNLHLGSSQEAGDYSSIPLYLTMADDSGAAAKTLKSLRKFMNAAKDNGVMAGLTGGKVVLNGQIPDSAYTLYMTAMLMLDQVSLDNINDADFASHVAYLREKLEPIIKDERTNCAVLQQALNDLNVDADLSPYESLINRVISVLRGYLNNDDSNLKIEDNNESGRGDLYGFKVTYDMADRISSMNGGDVVLKMLSSTEISVPVDIRLLNYTEQYQALIIDNGRTGTDKLFFTKDLRQALADAQGDTVAVLLDTVDTDEKIKVSHRTILNLNGKTLSADLDGQTAGLWIVDGSALGSTTSAQVNGSLYGKVRATAGTYTTTLTDENLQSGYVQDKNGTVTNQYFKVKEKDGNITLELSENLLDAIDEKPQAAMADILSDLVFNFYGNASLAVEQNEIYGIRMEDILKDYNSRDELVNGLISGVNTSGIKWLLKDVYDRLNDYDSISYALNNGTPLFSYEYTTAPWTLSAEVTGEGSDAHIALGIAPGSTETHTITVKFAKPSAEMAKLYEEMSKILSVETNGVSVSNIRLEDGKIKADIKADVSVVADFVNQDKSASGYVEVAAILMAADETDADAQGKLIDALKTYDATGYDEYLEGQIETVSLDKLVSLMEAAKTNGFKQLLIDLNITDLFDDEAQDTLDQQYQTFLKIIYKAIKAVKRYVPDSEKDRVNELLAKPLGNAADPEKDGSYTHQFTASSGDVKVSLTLNLFGDEYYSAARKVIDMIRKIDQNLNADNREQELEKVNAAREAYDALTNEEKEKVKEVNYADLVKAENYYKSLGLWVGQIQDQDYTGKAIKPQVRVYECTKKLQAKVDYIVSYVNNTKACEAPVITSDTKLKAPAAVIKFRKNYSGTIYRYFTINQIDLDSYQDDDYCEQVGLEIRDVNMATTTKAKYGKPALYLNGKKVSTSEYTLSYTDTTSGAYSAAGAYTIKIEGKGKNFTGTAYATQYMAGHLMSQVKVAKIPNQVYGEGSWNEPELQVTYKGIKLDAGRDYEVTYENNDAIGTAKVTVTGTNQAAGIDGNANWSFTGSKTVTYKITGEKLNSKMVSLGVTEKTFTGRPIVLGEDEYTVPNLTEGDDYEVSYLKNINKGTATVVFTGIGKYTGTVKKTFKIQPAALTAKLLTDAPETVTYVKGGVKPADEIGLKYNGLTLTAGKDYTISWKNTSVPADKTAAKAPQYRIKGRGNFAGTILGTYTIEQADLSQVTVTAADVRYKDKKNNYATKVVLRDVNGKKLAAGRDYLKTVTYFTADGEQAGERVLMNADEKEIFMTVKVTGTGAYTGVAEATYRLYSTSISKAKVTRVERYVTYNREDQVLANLHTTLYVGNKKLEEGTDYVVTYSKNFFAGTATATITGIGEYGGTRKVTFVIKRWNAWNALHKDDMNGQTGTENLQILWQW